MDMKQMEYFAAIVEEGSITAAARRLHMAQPPLSHMLKMLEEEVGVQLLWRGARRVTLTQAGRLLYDRAVQMLGLMRTTHRELEDLSMGVRGTLRIGTVSSSGAALLNRRMLDFHAQYPGVCFELTEGNTFQLIERLDAGRIELGVVRTPFHAPQMERIYLPGEPMVAVMAPVLAQGEPPGDWRIDALRGKPLIFYRRFEELITSCCARSGFTPQVFCMNDDARTTLLWANAGLGVGIVPESALQLVPGAGMQVHRLGEEMLRTQIAVIWRREQYLSSIAHNFLSFFLPSEEGGER